MSRRLVLSGAAAASVAAAYAALEGFPGTAPVATVEPDYNEAAAIESEGVKISHLLRRAGFGATKAEYDRYLAMGLDATIDEVVHYQAIDDAEALRLAAENAAVRGGPQLPWLVRMANTRRPLQEKMTLFWHGLITTEQTAVADTQALNDQNELLRRNATGDFGELLSAISRDRAMMVYLDMDGSVRSSPNENFARELLELFSMGEGDYTEQDIREAARAFTGWHVPRPNPNNLHILSPPVFRPELFDGGQKTFFGRRGNFGPQEIIEIVLEQPAVGRYLARRLFGFFAYPDPSEEVIEPFAAIYEASNHRIAPVLDALFRSEVFYSRGAYRALVKSPVEYAIGAIKAIGAPADTVRLLPSRAAALRNMGQVLFDPPNVAGWPTGALWFSSSALLARLNYINQLTTATPPPATQPGAPTPTPASLADLGTAEQAIEHYLPFVLDGNISKESRQVLLDYAGGPGTLLTDETLRGLVYLLLASPQCQLN